MSDPIGAARSVFNPNDAAAMSQGPGMQGGGGMPGGGMQIKDLLAKFGLTPEDPVERLAEVMKSQVKNANPIGKMESIAGQPAPLGPGPGGPPPGAPPGPPMDNLMSSMR